MSNTKPPDAAQTAVAAVYEFSGRRYVVRTVYLDDNGSSIPELLLHIMVNDGNHPSGNRDRSKGSVIE